MITVTNKTTRQDHVFTDEVWDMLERGGHDKNWTNIRKVDGAPLSTAPPVEVAEVAAKAALKERKPFGDNPPATA